MEVKDKDAQISIHSTARVETFLFFQVTNYFGDFNPLHREGGDLLEGGKDWKSRMISIHSTARVETR